MSEIMRNYALLTLRRGVNVQKGQLVRISAPLWAADFAHLLMEEALKLGARDVFIQYDDPQAENLRLRYASEEALCDVPRFMTESETYFGDHNAALIRVVSPKQFPDKVDPARRTLRSRAINAPLVAMKQKRMANDLAWTVVCAANGEWARQVFPELDAAEAEAALWQAIYDCCYVTETESVEGWDRHVDEMQKNVRKLNALKLRRLHLTNGRGTDLRLEIADGGVFAGGICHCPEPDGVVFAPNIPSEEILTTPHRFSANGVVYNMLPLVHDGQIIDDFCLTFKDGVVTDWTCGKNPELLRSILETDEGSGRLGEIALVPYNSPIREKGVLFYNTLFDENASCHLALGAGYTDVILGEDRSTEALVAKGLNVSMIHVDFMFGSADMRCEGEDAQGNTVVIFKDGVFAL